MSWIKKILIVLFIYVFSLLESFAGFGDSCSNALLPSYTDNYLKEYTLYGYIISSIDMRANLTSCDSKIQYFNFCIKKKIGSDILCKEFNLNLGEKITIGNLNFNKDLIFEDNELLNNIILTVKLLPDSLMCLTMPTSRGELPVACKRTNIPSELVPSNLPKCSNIGESCYLNNDKSQTLFNFSGTAVDCVKETLDKVFFRYNSCTPNNNSIVGLNPFSNFQESLKVTIRVVLILYVIFFAINMILTQENKDLDKISLFIMKMLLVTYFAVGVGPIFYQNGKETKANGMIEYGLPFLSNLPPYFAEIVFTASGNKGLCQFDTSKYKSGYHFYGIWDSIDCRIGYYLGLDLLYNTANILKGLVSSTPETIGNPINVENPSTSKSVSNYINNTGNNSFRFFMVIFGLFLGGNIIVVASGIAFCVIFLSILLYFLSNYLVCLVTIYAMAYISPIFIPMALFQRTKGYFDAWLRICISCTLQPAVIGGFIALLVTMYDTAIYKNCEFMRHDYEYNDRNFSTFEIRVPTSNPEECISSAGYKLLQYYSGYAWEEHLLIFFQIFNIRDILDLSLALIGVLVFSIIFYFFSKSIGQLAAEITGGPIMDAVTASPTAIVDAVKNLAKYMNQNSNNKSKTNPLEQKKSNSRKGGEEAGDKLSSGNSSNGSDALSSDMISGGSSGKNTIGKG